MSLALNLISYLPKPIRNKMIPEMRIPEIKNDPLKVQLARLSHIYFEHPDLDLFAKFADDFGFIEAKRVANTIYYRGYGEDQYVYVATKTSGKKGLFGGAAFEAQSREEFEKAKAISGAKYQTLDAPGGGELITFARPNGTFFHVIYGQVKREVDIHDVPSATHENQGPPNTPFEKKRKGQFQRYHRGPALVHKLGHYGYVCKEFDEEFEFYTSNFNIVPSDILSHPKFDNIDVMTFMHLDLGQEYSDHHCFFMQRAPPEVKQTYIHHSSYEVEDFDTQLIGHEHLASKGWKSVWGVGRHILGSQIFDYWSDPSGFKIEHYADGDVVNGETAVRREVAGAISIWGPELPKDFGADGTEIAFS